MNDIGKLIKRCREYRGMTQVDLAKKSGINNTTICYIENGISSPRVSTAIMLIKAMGFEPEITIREKL